MSLLKKFGQFIRIFGFEIRVDEVSGGRAGASAATGSPAARPSAGAADVAGVPEGAAVAAPAAGSAVKTLPPRAEPFVTPDLLARLAKMKPAEIDGLGFGCVRVSDAGIVQFYNRWESELAGVSPEEAVGRNFFRELAPCTNNRLIFGRFKEGVADDNLNVIVTYAFTYKMRPTLVNVHLYRDGATRTNWVLVQRSPEMSAKK